MRRLAAALLAPAAAIAPIIAPAVAIAQERPVLTPTRDVDVVYMMVQVDAPGGPRVVEERMRWAAAASLLRVDPPTPGMWVVIDTSTHRIATVRDTDRSVLEIQAPPGVSGHPMPGPAPASGATFLRRGTDSVAGMPCTEWQTSDVTGAPTLACITADGVLLRASAAGRVQVEALHLAYAPQDPALFRIPEDYRRITPPPVQRPAP